MAKIALFFISHDGQTEKIATILSGHLQALGQEISQIDLASHLDLSRLAPEVDAADLVIVLAAIRYGCHLKPAERFLKHFKDRLQEKPLAMLSVNLTARKPHKRVIENSVYLRKWVERHPLSPVLVRAIAGKLDYPRYRAFDRFMIRLIMRMTKGPTDPTVTIEFTDWGQVKELAEEIAALV